MDVTKVIKPDYSLMDMKWHVAYDNLGARLLVIEWERDAKYGSEGWNRAFALGKVGFVEGGVTAVGWPDFQVYDKGGVRYLFQHSPIQTLANEKCWSERYVQFGFAGKDRVAAAATSYWGLGCQPLRVDSALRKLRLVVPDGDKQVFYSTAFGYGSVVPASRSVSSIGVLMEPDNESMTTLSSLF